MTILGIVHIGHAHPDVFVRSILSTLLALEPLEGKRYYLGLNSADKETTEAVTAVNCLVQQQFPGIVTLHLFTSHPGLYGYSKANYAIMQEFRHDLWLQVASDMFPVTQKIDSVLAEPYLHYRDKFGTGYTGPVININEFSSPYFLRCCFPASKVMAKAQNMTTLRPHENYVYDLPGTAEVWSGTTDLAEQAKRMNDGIMSWNPTEQMYSCGLIMIHRETIEDLGARWYSDGGEETILWKRFNANPFGFVLNTNAYAAHFCYHPIFNAVMAYPWRAQIFDLIDKLIMLRSWQSPNTEKWRKVIHGMHDALPTPIRVR